MMRALLLSVIVLWSVAASAIPVVTLDGVVTRGAVKITDVFTATVEVTSDNGDVLVASSLPSLPVDDGHFTVTLDIAAAAPALESGEVLTLRVDFGDGLSSTTRLGRVWRSASAERADRALTAVAADALGDVPPAQLVPDGDSLTAPISAANLIGLPAGIADGVDTGTFDTFTGLVLSAGILDVAAGAITDISAGTLTGLQIADGTIDSGELGTLSANKVAEATLTGANFAAGAFAVTDLVGVQNVFRLPDGCVGARTLSTEIACLRETCTNAANCVGSNVCLRVCGTLVGCENLGTSPSATARLCRAPGDGYVAIGKIVRDPI